MTTMNIYQVNDHLNMQTIKSSAKINCMSNTSTWCIKETKAKSNK